MSLFYLWLVGFLLLMQTIGQVLSIIPGQLWVLLFIVAVGVSTIGWYGVWEERQQEPQEPYNVVAEAESYLRLHQIKEIKESEEEHG